MSYNTIAEMIIGTTNKYQDSVLYREKVDGVWKSITGKEARETIENASYGLASLGLGSGDKVAILSGNGPKWAFSDYAITTLGAASASIYPTLIPKQIAYILAHSESKAIFAQNAEQVSKTLEIAGECTNLSTIICMDDKPETDNNLVITFSDLMEKGKAFKISDDAYDFEERAMSVKKEDLLTLIYTSGTTGNPKGVMLSHNNLVTNVIASLEVLQVTNEDEFLSFLPLSHVFERMAGHYLATFTGATINYAEGIETVVANLSEINPTFVLSVPRLYEKMYAGVQAKFAAGSFLKRKIAGWAVKTGYAYVAARRAGTITSGLQKRMNLANKLVFIKIQSLVGNRFRYFCSGGAPLSAEIGNFFDAAGIKILEGYGLTETSPVLTVNTPEDYRFGTVGPTLSNVEVRIADDGEILGKAPSIMMGYFKDEIATKEAIDDEGWFHTGDIGVFDNGYLRITDRKKNLIVTAGGKNVAPAPMENAVALSKFVEQIIIIGDRRKFISALIVPTFVTLSEWAKENGISFDKPEDLTDNEKVMDLYTNELKKALVDFSHYETVKKFLLLKKEFTIEDGTLTPSMKIKKKIVEERFKNEIDTLYV